MSKTYKKSGRDFDDFVTRPANSKNKHKNKRDLKRMDRAIRTRNTCFFDIDDEEDLPRNTMEAEIDKSYEDDLKEFFESNR